ncbi:hypothetical protein OG241_41315 [Streptomyces sp. NBC_01390]|uniref:hypothetical protein n=1 Tax=Streptomyces sp. NBC_01390 TaxID=2903850 RepID=UPI00325235A6
MRAVDAFARIEYCALPVIVGGGIGLAPVPPDAAEGFCCLMRLVYLVAAATAYLSIYVWSVFGVCRDRPQVSDRH